MDDMIAPKEEQMADPTTASHPSASTPAPPLDEEAAAAIVDVPCLDIASQARTDWNAARQLEVDAARLNERAGMEALAAIVTWLKQSPASIRTYVVRRLRKMIAKGELD